MRFETHGKASEYCNRFGLKVRPVDVFDAAISLCNAYNAGRDEFTAENAKLREQLAAAVAALRTLNDEMSVVAYCGFDPERWEERIGALDAAGRVLAKHTTTA